MGVEEVAGRSGRLPVPVEGADGEPDLTPGQRAAFFEYIRAAPECSVKEACLAVGVKRRVVRALRRTDAAFEEDYRTARGYGPQQVMGAIVDEAIVGRLKPVVSAGKQVLDENGKPMYERVRSERLLEALYKSVTQEGVVLNPGKIEISGDVTHTVQRGVDLAGVAKVLLEAGVDLPALAAGDEPVDDAAEVVSVEDD